MDQFIKPPTTPIENMVLMLIERVQDLESSIAKLEKEKDTLLDRVAMQEAISTVFDVYIEKLCRCFDP